MFSTGNSLLRVSTATCQSKESCYLPVRLEIRQGYSVHAGTLAGKLKISVNFRISVNVSFPQRICLCGMQQYTLWYCQLLLMLLAEQPIPTQLKGTSDLLLLQTFYLQVQVTIHKRVKDNYNNSKNINKTTEGQTSSSNHEMYNISLNIAL